MNLAISNNSTLGVITRTFAALVLVVGLLAAGHPGQAWAATGGGDPCDNQIINSTQIWFSATGLTAGGVNVAPGTSGYAAMNWSDTGNKYCSSDTPADGSTFTAYLKLVDSNDNEVGSYLATCAYDGGGLVADTGQYGITCDLNFTAPSTVGAYHFEATLVEASHWSSTDITYDYTHNGGTACWDNSGTFDTETGSGCTSTHSGNVLSETETLPAGTCAAGEAEPCFTVQSNPHQLIGKVDSQSAAWGTPCASSDASCGTNVLDIAAGTPVSFWAGTHPVGADSNVWLTVTGPSPTGITGVPLTYACTGTGEPSACGTWDEWYLNNADTSTWTAGSYQGCFTDSKGDPQACVGIDASATGGGGIYTPPPSGSCSLAVTASPTGAISASCSGGEYYTPSVTVTPEVQGGGLDTADAMTVSTVESHTYSGSYLVGIKETPSAPAANWFGSLAWNSGAPGSYGSDIAAQFNWTGAKTAPGGQTVIGWIVTVQVDPQTFTWTPPQTDDGANDPSNSYGGEYAYFAGGGCPPWDPNGYLSCWTDQDQDWIEDSLGTYIESPEPDATPGYYTLTSDLGPCAASAPVVFRICPNCNVSGGYENLVGYDNGYNVVPCSGGTTFPSGGSCSAAVIPSDIIVTWAAKLPNGAALASWSFSGLSDANGGKPMSSPTLGSGYCGPVQAFAGLYPDYTYTSPILTEQFALTDTAYGLLWDEYSSIWNEWACSSGQLVIVPSSVGAIGGVVTLTFKGEVPVPGGQEVQSTCQVSVQAMPPYAQFTLNSTVAPGATQTYTDQSYTWAATPSIAKLGPGQGIRTERWYIWGPGTVAYSSGHGFTYSGSWSGTDPSGNAQNQSKYPNFDLGPWNGSPGQCPVVLANGFCSLTKYPPPGGGWNTNNSTCVGTLAECAGAYTPEDTWANAYDELRSNSQWVNGVQVLSCNNGQLYGFADDDGDANYYYQYTAPSWASGECVYTIAPGKYWSPSTISTSDTTTTPADGTRTPPASWPATYAGWNGRSASYLTIWTAGNSPDAGGVAGAGDMADVFHTAGAYAVAEVVESAQGVWSEPYFQEFLVKQSLQLGAATCSPASPTWGGAHAWPWPMPGNEKSGYTFPWPDPNNPYPDWGCQRFGDRATITVPYTGTVQSATIQFSWTPPAHTDTVAGAEADGMSTASAAHLETDPATNGGPFNLTVTPDAGGIGGALTYTWKVGADPRCSTMQGLIGPGGAVNCQPGALAAYPQPDPTDWPNFEPVPVTATIKALDESANTVSMTYQWTVNGNNVWPIGQDGCTPANCPSAVPWEQ